MYTYTLVNNTERFNHEQEQEQKQFHLTKTIKKKQRPSKETSKKRQRIQPVGILFYHRGRMRNI
jgi:hypothetical protein